MTRAAVLALVLLAAACTEEAAAPPAQQGVRAAGEVLPGSISDAMIPLEQLESQAPLAPRQAVPLGDIDGEQPEVTPVDGVEGALVPDDGAQSGGTDPAADQPQR